MNLVQKLWAIRTAEPEKTFKKLGIIDDRNNITIEGERLFMSWLFEKNKVEFKKDVCDELLAEQKKEEK